MSITTRGGDQGNTTHLLNGRVSKGDLCVELSGSFDDTITALGIAVASAPAEKDEILRLNDALTWCQHRLLTCAVSALDATAIEDPVSNVDVGQLDSWCAQLETELPPLKSFILPGGSLYAAQLHRARVSVRTTERVLARYADSLHEVDANAQAFLNRLSDFIFLAARQANCLMYIEEPVWDRNPEAHAL